MEHIKKDRLKIKFCELLQKTSAKLHLGPSTLATLTFELADADGIVEKRIDMKSNSFVRNYYNWVAQSSIFAWCSDAANTGVGTFGDGMSTPLKGISGSLRACGGNVGINSSNSFVVNSTTAVMSGLWNAGTPNSATHGVVVGTGNTAESFDSYNLATKIAHGTGVGQLQYGTPPYNLGRSWDLTTKKLTIAIPRTFTNGSGSTITINEIGLITYLYFGNAVSDYVLLIRDVLATPIDVPAGKTLTVTYNLSQIMSN